MLKYILSLIFILSFATLAAAQESVPKGEVFGGYSNLSTERSSINGFSVAVAGNISDRIALVGDVAGYGKNGINLGTFLAGPRYNFRNNSRFTPYVQGLAGVSAPVATFAFAVGGGLDYKMSDHISLRLIQAEYLQFRNDRNFSNNVRISTGIVFSFGKR